MATLTDLHAGTDALPGGNEHPAEAAEDDEKELPEIAAELWQIVTRVGAEEFRWQESHYDSDSRRGRELLFLMANNEWVRATSEIIDISRSDSIETTIKIDVDLDQVTHEAFRNRTGRFWLPVIVLPPPAGSQSRPEPNPHRLEPDPFATVTDAAGNLMPMLPTADARHQMSAAMAEIIVNMAVARWPGRDQERPTATRDQRLLLSAAIYRLLRRGLGRTRAAGGSDREADARADGQAVPRIAADRPVNGHPGSKGVASHMEKGRTELLRLLSAYNLLLVAPGKKRAAHDYDAGADASQFAPELARRAVRVLAALAESTVIVVPLDRDTAPTVVTVRVPTRSLRSTNKWKVAQPSTWPVRPVGHLTIDVLLPTADADREVQINLPDGVSFAESRPAGVADTSRPRLDIRVKRPQPFRELRLLLGRLLDEQQAEWPQPLRQCLADLAQNKAAAAREALRHYEASSEKDQAPADIRLESTTTARDSLDELAGKLAAPGGGSMDAVTGLEDSRENLFRQTRYLFRRTSAERAGPRTLVARADMIEDVSLRAVPREAKIAVDVAVTDDEYFSIARFSGRMSLLLMAMVLVLLVAWRLLRHTTGPSPEVLAIVLTLFSALQAGQMERQDRSTLRGLLSAPGNWLIAASIVPALALAVALAFPWGGWVPTIWAAVCVTGQIVFQAAMSWSPLATTESARPEQRHTFFTDPLNYEHFTALRSNYWRSTTADALMIGRPAFGYVVWQRSSPPPQLHPLLSWRSGSMEQSEAANILALLRSGTVGQATTFVVFRKKPGDDWTDHADQVTELDLDPNRLAPMESIASVVDVFVGVSRDRMLTMGAHPIVKVLKAAGHKLIVLDAQLPVPAPVAGYEDRRWARVRVALRDADDIRRLVPFLSAVRRSALAAPREHRLAVAVRTVSTVVPRLITRASPAPDGAYRNMPLVLADDLDVVSTGAHNGDGPGARTWRAITICSDAWSGIESDIAQGVALMRPPLQLAGLTYGLLHGMAVVVILAHEPPGAPAADRTDIEAKLRHRLARAKLRVPMNRDLARAELGSAGKFPVLRIHFRWQDRPGALLNVLTALNATLQEPPHSIEPADWSIMYAQAQVSGGRSVQARVTIRIHNARAASWRPADLAEIGQKVQTLAAQEAAAGRPADPGGRDDPPEDPAISVELIEAPAES
jgi:hypothetical protein